MRTNAPRGSSRSTRRSTNKAGGARRNDGLPYSTAYLAWAVAAPAPITLRLTVIVPNIADVVDGKSDVDDDDDYDDDDGDGSYDDHGDDHIEDHDDMMM